MRAVRGNHFHDPNGPGRISGPGRSDARMGTVTGENPAAAPGGAVRAAELAIGGMTCASCAARIEKKLNKLDGVAATVNFATETAQVTFPAAMPPDELVSAVERAGYAATLPALRQDEPAGQAAEDDGAAEADSLRQRLLVSLALAIPVVVLAMVPALQFRNWQWASLALASPVAVWGAWPFHRAAIAAAIAAGARDRLDCVLPVVAEFDSHQVLGVTGVVGSRAVAVGRAGWLDSEWAMTVPAGLAARAAAAEAAGQTAVFAGWDGQVRGLLAVADTIKPTSAEAIARLRRLGLRPVLLTGDNERAARAVAAAVGIDEVIAGVLPAGKVAAIRRLQQAGRVVAMAGDGVNDAAALAQADLGLAMGTGTDAAIEASDLTLVRGDLLAVPDAILLSRRTLATIKEIG